MKPLLSAKIASVEQLRKLKYPLLASPKLDGIRCLIHPERGPVTRKLLAIPNAHVRKVLTRNNLLYLDGELVVGDVTDKLVYVNTVSGVMSVEGKPDFTFYVFDNFRHPERGYLQRHGSIRLPNVDYLIRMVSGVECRNADDVLKIEEHYLGIGYEGVMLRSPMGLYKFNRSTLNEQYLMKFKRFTDDDAKVVGFKEYMHNNNEMTRNELGYAKRSGAKAGRVAAGMLGALICTNRKWTDEFDVGTGFTHEQRKQLWAERDTLVGRTIKFKHQEVGAKDKPRFPVFLAFRKD